MTTKYDKRIFIANTITQLKNQFPDDEKVIKKFENLLDTVYHSAPEIIDTRWRDIFNYCHANFNDPTNSSHTSSLTIYNSRIREYHDIFCK